ncbi:hypothetical protein Peur_064215 [Populus x canadensis]|jgi:hypothetical protein
MYAIHALLGCQAKCVMVPSVGLNRLPLVWLIFILPLKSYVFSLFGPYGEKLPYAASVVFQIPYWGLVLWIMDC